MPYGASMIQMTESPRMNNFGTNLSLFTGLCPGVFSVHISFASRRIRLQCLSNAFIRPKTLESLIMINRAYEMMNKINSVVENNEDKDALADEDMEGRGRSRAHVLLKGRIPKTIIN